MVDIDRRANEWIVSNDTGISSKTIWAVMMNAVPDQPHWTQFGVPHDGSDFGRCYRLLQLIPEWRAKLDLVAARFKLWGPLVLAWDVLTALYELKRYYELYKKLEVLEDEGRLAAGWEKTGSGSWRGLSVEVVEFRGKGKIINEEVPE